MVLFDESIVVSPAPRTPRKRSRRAIAGFVALAVALACMFALSLMPSGFVIQEPGPVVNTLGAHDNGKGEEIPLISIGGDEKTYPTAGTLSLVTVQVRGSREGTPTWIELASAWFDPAKAVLPIDAVFPVGVTSEERKEADQAQMVDSQNAAAAAALTYLDYTFPTVVLIAADPAAEYPAAGKLKQGDVVTAVNGTPITSASEVTAAVQASDGKPVTFSITRDGAAQDVTITPQQVEDNGTKVWRVGASIGSTYELPVPIDIQLNNIGGPSAGMMFALGIIDEMTPGELNGGKDIAGTGTIDKAGTVGAIGGIRQKMYGARNAGNDYFLAPAANCNEVVGHIPDGLTVIKTETLEQSVTAVETIASGTGIEDLPRCTS